MKTIFKPITFIFAATLAIASCDTDKLDIEQQGVISTSIYSTANDKEVEELIGSVYSAILGDSYQSVLGGGPASYRYINYFLARMGGETSNYYQYTDGTDARIYSAFWSYYYRLAYWCNMIITNLPNNKIASESVKSQVTAEARAMRAISMMYLVKYYGNPPLADHVLDGSEANTPATDSWMFIESELKAAAEELPTKAGLGGQKAIGGRITKEAAYAYLGKAYLWQGKYSEAASILYDKVISTGKYALDRDYSTLSSSANDFSDENLFEFNFADDADYSTAQEGCFDLACFSPAVSVWTKKYASIMMAWGMGSSPSKSFVNFMKKHDGENNIRYQETIIPVDSVAKIGTFTYPISDCEGYFRTKDLCLKNDLVGSYPFFYTKRNVVYMRYAEVLLNYAEAVAMGGNDGAGLTGLQALNMVRERVGLPDAPNLDMNNEIYGIKAEREAELFNEGERFIDLVRWGDAPTVLADCGKKTYTLMSYNDDGTPNITETNSGGNGFQKGKNELFPIPQSDMNSDAKLVQNTGW